MLTLMVQRCTSEVGKLALVTALGRWWLRRMACYGWLLRLIGMGVVCAIAQTAAAQPSVTDDFGHVVTLSKPAQRILSLSPHNTENLFSAGAGDNIVGVTTHSDYPPQASHIASVGNSYAQLNLEAVLALAPDLVVAWETAGNRESLQKIAQFGFPVYYSEPRDFHRIIKNIEDFAVLAGLNMPSLTAQLRTELAQLRTEFSQQSPQSVFYQISASPLMTVNGQHLLSRTLEVCGAHNVFAHLPLLAPQLSVESVLQANPDIIVVAQFPHPQSPQSQSQWKKWNSLSAVQHDAFVWVDSDLMHRQTARMIMSIRNLCEQIEQIRQRREP